MEPSAWRRARLAVVVDVGAEGGAAGLAQELVAAGEGQFSPVEMRTLSISALMAGEAGTAPAASLIARAATDLTMLMKPSFLAVKSVSARTSTMTAAVWSGLTSTSMRPSPAARSVRD